MLPADLTVAQFASYPPEARRFAVAYLPTLRLLPLSFLPSLLSEIIDYAFKFPAEREAIDRELNGLSKLSAAQLDDWFGAFSRVRLTPGFEQMDWLNQPAQFVEQLSAYLWSTHQLDAFRQAASEYGTRVQALAPPAPLPLNRLSVAILGRGVDSYPAPLFRKLHEQGTYFTHIQPEDGVKLVLEAAAARAQAHPLPYSHWYVDGGAPASHDASLTSVSYQQLAPARAALLRDIQNETAKPGMGPEQLHAHLARLSPGALGMQGDVLLDRFQLKLLTEGSGTQIFSTTFAQWAAREVLRRAQPMTLVTRYAPRQRQRPMNELLSGAGNEGELDPVGSLVDAEMAAYYQWINQRRLPGADRSAFVVWFEGHAQALAIGPHLPRGVESSSAVNLKALIDLAVG